MRDIKTLLVCLSTLGASAAWAQDAKCAGLPKINAHTVSGWCLGVIADADLGLRMPRNVLWLNKTEQGAELLIVDMGSWEPMKGRLLHLSWTAASKQVKLTELLKGLDRPHGLRRGPDGAIYLGEATQISRFVWSDSKVTSLTKVLSDLPAEGRHPLKALVFGADRNLYFNVGAATDRCQGAGSQLLAAKDGLPQCSEFAGKRPQAAVYIAKMKWPGAQVVSVTPYAWGLRNSMGLAAHSGGLLLQAENNIDFSEENFPPEELNVLKEGAHYGWPSCVGVKKPIPGVNAATCAKTQAPVALIAAHASPLHMEYSSTDFTSKTAGQAKTGLLVSLHGYRSSGQKIIRYDTSAEGLPLGLAQELIGQWKLNTSKNKPALGAPVGWAQDDRGHLWIADDRNRMIVWFGREDAQP